MGKDPVVWDEFTLISAAYTNGKAKAQYQCNHCPQKYAENGSTFKAHLGLLNELEFFEFFE
jgi:transposase-like protein